MICDKCGNNNPEYENKCVHCGADLPVRSKGGGFGDILNYETVGSVAPSHDNTVRVNENNENIRRLSRRIDNLSEKIRKMAVISVVLAAFCAVALVVSVVALVKGSGAKEEPVNNVVIATELAQTTKEPTELPISEEADDEELENPWENAIVSNGKTSRGEGDKIIRIILKKDGTGESMSFTVNTDEVTLYNALTKGEEQLITLNGNRIESVNGIKSGEGLQWSYLDGNVQKSEVEHGKNYTFILKKSN